MRFFLWIKKILFFCTYLAFVICGLYACASVGSPGGGDYDVDPPRFVRSVPEPNTTNFTGNQISIWFDEYINITNPTEKVIITPPQLKAPVIRAIGRRAFVELNDSLIPNTTYTFDFTDAIVDNNESNALQGFSFAFSTGDVVDSLEISGLLLNAENLEPMPKVIVGIHSDLSDSAFLTKPFIRTSQTNDRGKFSIRNIAPGTYRLYALQDANRDFKFDNPAEAIAFLDSLVVPDFEPAIRTDTIWQDTLTIDTILTVPYTRFTPDDVVLRLFNEKNDVQYRTRAERIFPYQFVMEFNSDIGMPPGIRLLDPERENNNWYTLEQSPDQKTMTYWITDSLVYQQDTLMVKVDYLQQDTLNNLVESSDTIRLYQRGRNRRNNDRDNNEEKIEFMHIGISPTAVVNVYDTVKITFSEPVLNFDTDLISMEQKVDTLWQPVNLSLTQDSLNPRIYYFDPRWPYKEEYKIKIDSATFYSVYGKWNDSIQVNIKTRAEDEYANLYVAVSGIEPIGFGQLLNRTEKIIKESQVIEGELRFQDVPPGKYFLRYIDDRNRNGKWDTGNFIEGIQPEGVYYYPGEFELKKYMEWEQSWDITALPVDKQKPLEITKNKPVEKQPKRSRNEERQQTNTSNTSSGGLPGTSIF
ncbi:MAG: Ig-like domain-containing protein [Bacteroidales bacterium]|nr:Ig-like domain-containing protein [Bacteroidales bacterium]